MPRPHLQKDYEFTGKAQCISFMMCKGGVGKTTVSFFLGKFLASYGARVLWIDADPQGNLTAALRPTRSGFSVNENTPVLMDVLDGKCRIQKAILRFSEKIHLLPSTAINSLLERKLIQQQSKAIPRVRQVLRSVENDYDYILVDCAPSLNVANASIIYASDNVMLPVQLDEFSRLGLRQTLSEVEDLQKEFGFNTKVKILLNKFNARERLSFLYLGNLVSEYRPLMMKSIVRQNAEIKMALSLQRDFFDKDNSRAREDFDNLAREIMPAPIGLSEAHA